MDTGIFLSSKRRFLFYSLSPALFLAIFHISFSGYFDSAHSSLKERKAQAEYAPIISEKIKKAEDILKYHEVAESRADIIQMLNEKLEEMARRTNFTVSLLTVKPKKHNVASGGISVFKVTVRGRGSFAAVIKFFNETYKLGKLFSVETMSLRADELELPISYEADFEFFYHAICK